MKTLSRFLPHLALAMLLGLMVITVLDGYNPLMAFLTSQTSKIYIFITCVLGIVCCCMLIARQRARRRRKR
jgi:hypothetical protein